MTEAVHEPSTVVTVFADIGCPYAHVGLRRFFRRRASEARADLRLHVRAWPLELVNGEPLDPGHVAEQIEALREQVTPDLFSRFNPYTFPHTTLPALELVSDAYAMGLSDGERASLAVRNALFERGEDISDQGVLERLRHDLWLPPPRPDARERILADWADGQRLGVVGSPHFFVGDRDFFCPTLRITREGEHRHIRNDPARFDEFFARCAAA
jgi:2-hydroxychromene-2-carboxylate isomerase